MAQLRRHHEEFVRRQVKVLVIGPENERAFQNYWKENDLPFTGLSDPKASVLKLYGQEVNFFKFGRMPAQALVDRKGIVRYVHYGHSMSDIPESQELLRLVDQMDAQEKGDLQ